MKRKYKTHVELEEINKKLLATTIVGWSLNFLLVLFLVLVSIFGGKSAHGVSAEVIYNDNYTTFYRFSSSNVVHLDSTTRNNLTSYCELTESADDYHGETHTYYYNVFPSYTIYDEDDYTLYNEYESQYLGLSYYSVSYGSAYNWMLVQCKLYDSNYHAIGNSVLTKSNSLATSYDYTVLNCWILQLLESSPNLNKTLSVFCTLSDDYNYLFNPQINYNAPIGLTLATPYGSGGSWTSSTDDTAQLVYNTGWFVSNGQLFDRIRLWYFNSGAMYFPIKDKNGNVTITQGADGQWAFMFLYYENSLTNTEVLVNHRDQIAFQPSSTTYAYYEDNSSTWVDSGYRKCLFLNLDDSTRLKINAFNNSSDNLYGNYDNNNVFTLIGSAFSSWISILGITILPNITLGMLLFVPLVALLVFAIIRIIKK